MSPAAATTGSRAGDGCVPGPGSGEGDGPGTSSGLSAGTAGRTVKRRRTRASPATTSSVFRPMLDARIGTASENRPRRLVRVRPSRRPSSETRSALRRGKPEPRTRTRSPIAPEVGARETLGGESTRNGIDARVPFVTNASVRRPGPMRGTVKRVLKRPSRSLRIAPRRRPARVIATALERGKREPRTATLVPGRPELRLRTIRPRAVTPAVVAAPSAWLVSLCAVATSAPAAYAGKARTSTTERMRAFERDTASSAFTWSTRSQRPASREVADLGLAHVSPRVRAAGCARANPVGGPPAACRGPRDRRCRARRVPRRRSACRR